LALIGIVDIDDRGLAELLHRCLRESCYAFRREQIAHGDEGLAIVPAVEKLQQEIA
jgi:hypothetical protein